MLKTSKNYQVFELKLEKKVEEAKNTFTYYFSKPQDLEWDEGAHTHLALDRFNEDMGWWEKKDVRHFSIMSLKHEPQLAITTRVPALHSGFKDELSTAEAGDRFYLFKVGSRVKLRRENKSITLISAGVGMATMRPVVLAGAMDSNNIKDIYSLNIDSSGEYLFFDELTGLAERSSHISVDYVSGRQAFYDKIQNRLDLKEAKEGFFFIIGSDQFIIDVAGYLMKQGIEIGHIVLDKKEEFIKENFYD